MPDRQYPEPTRAQDRWMSSAVPILASGEPQATTKAYIIQPCIDIRPAGRIYAGQALDKDMFRVWDKSFIDEMYRVMTINTGTASDELPYLNWQAISKFRYRWLRPYLATTPGGFFSAELAASLMTVAVHAPDLELEGVVQLDHDNCAAADSTKLNLVDASRLTLASIYQWAAKLMEWGVPSLPMADDVVILVGNVRTEKTEVTSLSTLTSYNHQQYEQALAGDRLWPIVAAGVSNHRIDLLDPAIDPAVAKSQILDRRLREIFTKRHG